MQRIRYRVTYGNHQARFSARREAENFAKLIAIGGREGAVLYFRDRSNEAWIKDAVYPCGNLVFCDDPTEGAGHARQAYHFTDFRLNAGKHSG